MPSKGRIERRPFGRWGWALALTSTLAAASPAGSAGAQRPVTLEEAVVAAEASAPELAVARADSAAARAELSIARIFPNPSLLLDYSKAVPRHHVVLEQPIDYPGVLRARTRAARVALGAAGLLSAAARVTVRYRVELAYWRAAGAAAVLALARQNVENGAALVRSVRARRDAGDASDLDVALAEITLGQLRSALLTDSLEVLRSTLELQSLMGLAAARVEIRPADSLAALPPAPPPVAAEAAVAGVMVAAAGAPLRIAAAEQQLGAEQARVQLAERSRFPALALRAGFEQGDPSERGILPTFGLSVPLPLFSRGGPEVAAARASAARAVAELATVRRETELARATAERERDLARARLAIDRAMVAEAEKVAALSLTAYREGAYPLATVLEAQRNARDALRQYLDDLVAGRTAEAALALALSAGGAPPP